MSDAYDVVVVGLGVMGGSAALHLARRGLRVLGVDRWAPPHAMGSSHGGTRLIRTAIPEGPWYVPLVRRARELWLALDAELGGTGILQDTGLLSIGATGSALVRGVLGAAQAHGIAHEVLDDAELHRRFPVLHPLDDMVAVFEPGAALLWPERIVALQVELAQRAGATLAFGTRVEAWEPAPDGIAVRAAGTTYHCGRLVLCAGPWNATLLPSASVPLQVERQVQEWWEPARLAERFTPAQMPVTMWELMGGRTFYTMPDRGEGLKVGWHHGGAVGSAESVDRDVSLAEHAAVTDLLRRFMPHAKGRRRSHAVCMYTNTPDGHFIVDHLPQDPRVLLVSACSGHGFKYGSVLGALVAERVATGAVLPELDPFRLTRFAA